MSYDVFISYSSANSAEAQAVCAALEAAGLTCWIAPRNIVAGADWASSIITGLNTCRLMLLLFSEFSNTSPQVANEVERATHKRVPVLTVRLQDLTLTPHLEYFLSGRHWFEAHVPPLAQHLPALVQTVQQALATTAEGQAGAVGKASPSAPTTAPPLIPAQTAPPLPNNLLSTNLQSNNLPEQVTSFIGREKEMRDVKSLLAKTRLLTLTASGGSGKTRLSLQVAADVLDHCPDGAWFVELAPLADSALVSQTLAQVLGVTEEAGKPLAQTLTLALRDKKMLIVLDNCEHVLTACARLVDALLKHCPHVQTLASSREALGIAGEQTYRIPSLSLPDVRQAQTVASVSQYEAVQLFIDRAQSVQSTFAVTDTNATALAQLCARLDGIPLALELAAARVRSLSVEEINSKLDNRFRLLTGGSRAALPRQQTLRALIDWSYDLLNAQEKTLLCRLAVFAGGWTLEATEAVGIGNDIEDWEMLDLLTSLADKSLVVAEQEAGQTRYRLLETVRQYGRDRLEESGEGLAVRARHGDYFLMLAEEIEPKLQGSEQGHWLQVLEAEHDNLRQALTLYTENLQTDYQAGEKGLRLGAALQRFWQVRGYLSEGRERLRAALGHPQGQEPTRARADALHSAGVLAYLQGDYTGARTLYEEGLTIGRALGYKDGIANCLLNLGNVTHEQGDYESGRVLLGESLVIWRELDDKNGIAACLNALGIVARVQWDYEGGQVLLEESLMLRRELGDKTGIAACLLNLGIVARLQEDYAQARLLYEESLALRRELGDKHGIAACLNVLGVVAYLQGDYEAGRMLSGEGLTIACALGYKKGMANALINLGNVAYAQGDYEEGRVFGENSLVIWRELGDRGGAASCLNALGSGARKQGDYDGARVFYEESLALRRELKSENGIADCLNALGIVASLQGDYARAHVLHAESLTIAYALGYKSCLVGNLEGLALLAGKEAQENRSVRLWGAATTLREAIGASLSLADNERQEREMTTVREIVGEDTFALAWTEGRAMTLEQAIEYALEKFEPPE